ncbi:MAG: hypothetical protein JNL18_24595 [Planctomycetaceae bacterium]|nr:hypothetical protein [Planctomycetaceae bacterium]
MPLEDAMIRYIDGMPEIYKDIFRAFPRAEPRRRQGDSLFLSTIAVVMKELGGAKSLTYHFADVEQACVTLARYGFFRAPSVNHSLMLRPTQRGEEVIEYLSGVHAEQPMIPALDPPPGFVAT